MKTFNYVLYILLASVILCTSCSKDDDVPQPQDPTEDAKEMQKRQLSYLQESIVRVDSVGNVLSRPLGAMLNDADTTVLSVGVKDIAEATKIFKSLFNEGQSFKESEQTISTDVADGSVIFSPVSGSHIMAHAIFDVPSLFHISKIDFILQSAWPTNDGESTYKFGDAVTKECSIACGRREITTLVCIREYTSGTNGILVGQSPILRPGFGLASSDSYPASRADANLVAGIISSDWDGYTALWKSKGVSPELSDSYLWISDASFFKGRYVINLKRHNFDYWCWAKCSTHEYRELVVQYFQTIK